jgi:hypothetical protein
MAADPRVQVYAQGTENEFPGGPPTVVVTHDGFHFELRFADGDVRGEGPLQELRITAEKPPLKPRALRRFSPQTEIYVALSRAALRVFGPEGTPESRRKDLAGAVDALREVAGPGRGHPDDFYRKIATSHAALVSEGEPHPVKALSQNHHVTISTASRWVKEARRRGYIEPKGGKS